MTQQIRPPAVAGMFYVGDAPSLRGTIQSCLERADPPRLDNVRAVIAPHAGYVYSGPVAAFAYRALAQQAAPRRIYLLGPAHRVWVSGVALADYDAFETPLGTYPVDRAQVRALVDSSPLFSVMNSAHAPEHSLEVQVPFLQTIYDAVPMVPLLFGEGDPVAVGDYLNGILEPGDQIIVSSDLSHFHDNATAHAIDRRFIDAVLSGDLGGIEKSEACGQAPVMALHAIAQARGWQPHLLDYRTSGDVVGDPSRVVGYAAIAYTEARS